MSHPRLVRVANGDGLTGSATAFISVFCGCLRASSRTYLRFSGRPDHPSTCISVRANVNECPTPSESSSPHTLGQIRARRIRERHADHDDAAS